MMGAISNQVPTGRRDEDGATGSWFQTMALFARSLLLLLLVLTTLMCGLRLASVCAFKC